MQHFSGSLSIVHYSIDEEARYIENRLYSYTTGIHYILVFKCQGHELCTGTLYTAKPQCGTFLAFLASDQQAQGHVLSGSVRLGQVMQKKVKHHHRNTQYPYLTMV